MKPHVVFLHTVTGLTDLFDALGRELLPPCTVSHVADQTLIQRLLAAEGLTPAVYRRVCDHVVAAEEAGADLIQFTCSSITPCVDVAARLVSMPILSIDAPMMRAAVLRHARIGVIATNPATLEPSVALLQRVAQEAQREITVRSAMCPGAYAALFRGERDQHDRIVREHLAALLEEVDAVCLAQASMARLAEGLPEGKPVYASPRFAMEHLAGLLRGKGAVPHDGAA